MKKKTFKSSSLIKFSGFSLIEVSVVIIIVGIMIAAVFASNALITKSRLKMAESLTNSSPITGIKDNELWLETSLDSSLIDSEASDDKPISAWNNQSKSANQVSVKAVGLGPVYSNTINRIHAIKFDAASLDRPSANNYLEIEDASFLNNSDYTIFVLEKRMSDASSNYFLGDPSGSVNQTLALGYMIDNKISHSQGTGTSYDSIVSIYNNSKQKARLFTFVHSATSGNKTYINGLLAGQDNTKTEHLKNINSLAIGKGYTGEIGEIAIFSRALSDKDRFAIEDYLSKKWDRKNLRESAPDGSCLDGVVTDSICDLNNTSCATGYVGARCNSCDIANGYSMVGGVCQKGCSVSVTGASTTNVNNASGTFTCDQAGYSGTITYTCVGSVFATDNACVIGSSDVICTSSSVDTTSVSGSTIHKFNSSGTLSCSKSTTAEVLIVGGGGGGGSVGGGGGGGTVFYDPTFAITAQNYTITVGNGGATNGGNGEASSIKSSSNTILVNAVGGGGGGAMNSAGKSGGSGGGGGRDSGTGGTAGTDPSPTSTGAFYRSAGGGHANSVGYGGGSGGGGARGSGGIGGNTSGSEAPGAGGTGYESSISGTSEYYAGGGGGGNQSGGALAAGGSGVGGNGGNSSTSPTGGKANTGSGGGGSGNGTSAAGSSGVAIIRYITPTTSCPSGYILSGSNCIKSCDISATGISVSKVSLGSGSLTCNSSEYSGSISYTCNSSGSVSTTGSCQLKCNSGLPAGITGPLDVGTSQTATCGNNYTGSITYSCNNGSFTLLSGSCAAAPCTGGTVTNPSSGVTVHSFTSSGSLSCPSARTVKVLVVGGGGGGSSGGGGGGGGTVFYDPTFALTAQNYTITVGAGGTANGGNGVASSIKNSANTILVSASGGGAGGGSGSAGQAGGSGGGGGRDVGAGGLAGTEPSPTSTGAFYRSAGGGHINSLGWGGGSGGGGAGGPGASGNGDGSQGNESPGSGGLAYSSSISGEAKFYAGGGGGGNQGNSTSAAGGSGVGGHGGASGVPALEGAINTGSGGGGTGSTSNTPKAGGSGIVIISY